VAAMKAVLAAATARLPQLHPIRRPIAGDGIAHRIHQTRVAKPEKDVQPLIAGKSRPCWDQEEKS